MLPFQKILLPVDYSPPVAAVVPYVRDLVEHFSAELMLVHAYSTEAPGLLPITDPHLPEDTESFQNKRLEQFANTYFPGAHAELFTGVGEPAGVVHEVVKRQGADLVMLPTHGHSPLRQMLVGSITTKLLHDLTVPVWTCHPPQEPGFHLSRPGYSKILCAIDGPEEAELVLRAGAALAESYGAKVLMVSVIELPLAEPDMNYAQFREDLKFATEQRLSSLKEKVGVDAELSVVEGLVPDEIQRESARWGADLIVTGRGGMQGTLGRLWSHLYPIIRHAACPVLSI